MYNLFPISNSFSDTFLNYLKDEPFFNLNEKISGFPPYDIKKISDDEFHLILALAGYEPERIKIISEGNTLNISANHIENDDEYLYHGIANRGFEQQFKLGKYVEVISANLIDGLLKICLKRIIPEDKKPKQIPIETKLLTN